jgi:hypothetical protein
MRLGEKCPRTRECCVCHDRASFNFKLPPAGETPILSVSLSVYLRKNKKRIFRACPRVQICLKCLSLASAFIRSDDKGRGGDSIAALRFLRGIVASLSSIDALEQYPEQEAGAKNA